MKKIIRTILTIVLVVVMVYALFQIYEEIDKYADGRAVYHKIAEVKESTKKAKKNKKYNKLDFDRLSSINPDVIAWLELKGTKIDYPVVQGTDNKTYLKTAFDGSKSKFGTLFVDCNVDNPFEDFNTIIYGHHMKDGSMFQFIDRFKKKNVFEQYQTFDLYTPNKNYEIDVIAYLNVKYTSKIYQTAFYDDESKTEYLELIKHRAKRYVEKGVSIDDKLVTMSTCTFNFENARSVVIGVLREK